MMKPYYEENNIKIYNSDIMPTLKEMADESIDCAITSPPYWALRDYGIEPSIWDGAVGCQHKFPKDSIKRIRGDVKNFTNKPIVGSNANEYQSPIQNNGAFCSRCGAWRGSLGLEPTFELYIKHLCDIFDEIKRVLKKSGTCWVNLGDTYGGSWSNYGARNCHQRKRNTHKYIRYGSMPKNWKPPTIYLPQKSLVQIPSRFSIEMTNRGWVLRNEIIWHKPNCMPSSVRDRFTVDFEKIFFFVKDKKYWFERQFETIAESTIGRGPVDFGGKKGREYKPEKNDPNYRGGNEQWGRTFDYKKSCEHGHNKRCVWRICPKPFKEAHFAVFPEKLVETPIKAGCPEFVCNKCEKPREKIYKREQIPRQNVYNGNKFKDQKKNMSHKRIQMMVTAGRKAGLDHDNPMPPQKFIKHTSCKCKAGFSGGVVLDPFMGSGTVAVVAKRLNRQFIGIDIKKDYCKMAIKRIKNTQKDMFV